MKRWTEDEVKFLKENYKNMSYIEIGKILNRKDSAIRAKCFDLDLVKTDRWTEKEIEFLKENCNILTYKEIAKVLNRTTSAISLKSKKLGIKKYEYNCNKNFFENIDSEEKAYWLGFIMADGWISINDKTNSGTVGIELQKRDEEHLKKFNKLIEGNYKISERERTCNLSKEEDKNKLFKTSYIKIYSIKMAEDLVKLGCIQNKTYNLKFPVIEEELIRHFIRGFFDGDGCVRIRTNKYKKYPVCDFTGICLDFLTSIRKILYKHNINTCIYQEENGTYRLMVHKNKDTLNFLKFIYDNSNIYLERKFARYQEILCLE